MNIFFSCSTDKILKYADNYRAIRDEIINQGHNINRDWIDYTINLAKRKNGDIDSRRFYKDVISAILTADAVVVDATVRSMSVGHQVAYALQKEKPILLLCKKSKDQPDDKYFVQGANTKNLVVAEYEKINDIHRILHKFFLQFENKPKKRFNLVLNEGQYNYISWVAFQFKKSKTEVIQESIDKQSRRDTSYQSYLSRQM